MMNLLDLLNYLHDGAYPIWKDLILSLDNASIKSLRLIHKALGPELFPFMFSRIYISAHDVDLSVFRCIADHPVASRHVTDLIWDDTRFDQWIHGFRTYKDRLDTITTTPSHILQREADIVTQAYLFWASEATSFAENRAEDVDRHTFEEHIMKFPNLRNIYVLSRSRLTYVDPQMYWSVYQTPRTRVWARKSFARYLLQPEPYKPSTGTTVSESEGIRPIHIIRTLARNDPRAFAIGALSLNSIGGGQSRPSGGNMVTSDRFTRKWHIDLHALTSSLSPQPKSHPTAKQPLALHLLLETQTEDIFRHSGVLEDTLDLLLMDTASSLTSLTVANICLDWFFNHSTLAQSQTPYLRKLKSVRIEGGSSHNPTPFLLFLAQQTSVRDVEFDGLHLEGTTWSEVLHELREQGAVQFEKFALKPSRGKAQIFPRPVELWVLPTIVFGDQIVPWLRRETGVFPLVC